MNTIFPISIIAVAALLGVPAHSKDSSSSATYSNFPSETALATTEGNLRVLHRDDFSNDSLHRIWGCSHPDTTIAEGVLKAHSSGGSSGKLKVSVEPFTDGELRFRFKLGSSKGFGFGFDDLTAKELSHGGHLIGFSFSNGRITVKDTLTGIYNMDHYEQFKNKTLTPELNALFAKCETVVPFVFKSGQWYQARVVILGDQLELYIDDSKFISFKSPGIAHPRKDMYRFNIGKGDMEFDDISLVSYSK